MSSDSPEHVLQLLSEEYQSHLLQIQKVESTIEQQQKMMSHHTIPKMYRPRVLTTINCNKSITEDFNKGFEKLFFQHLERVLTSNSIILEIEKGHLERVLSEVDEYLNKLNITPLHRTQLHDNFSIIRETPEKLARLQLHDHMNAPTTNTPTSQDSPTTSSPSTPTPTVHPSLKINRKRKHRSKHPTGRKATKPDHFLCQGPTNQPQPP